MTSRKERLRLTPPSEVYNRDVTACQGYRVLLSNQGTKRHKHPTRRLNEDGASVTCAVPGCSVLTNRKDGICRMHFQDKSIDRKAYVHFHTADWYGALLKTADSNTLGTARVAEHFEVIDWLLAWAGPDQARVSIVVEFTLAAVRAFHGVLDNATELQRQLVAARNGAGPDSVIATIVALVDRFFPSSTCDTQSVNIKFKDLGEISLPLKIGATMLALGLACEEINRGDATDVGVAKAKRAGCWMPVTYLLLRTRTELSRAKARICVNPRH